MTRIERYIQGRGGGRFDRACPRAFCRPAEWAPLVICLVLSPGDLGFPLIELSRMSVTYYKRYRMEVDLQQQLWPACLPVGYRLVPWSFDRLDDHAETKYLSFRHEIDSSVFDCLGDLGGCQRLMEEIASKEGFLPEATWLVEYEDPVTGEHEMCGTIQGVRVNRHYGGIQNIGVTPFHRGQGIGAALVAAALTGFEQQGLPRAYLEVTARNKGAIRLYKHLGFRRTKTLYKAVEVVCS